MSDENLVADGRVWLSSDTHYGHRNIIGYCRRPFVDIDEMERHLIEGWNANVSEGELVLFLGDFAMHHGVLDRVLGQLTGQIFLFAGNHDHRKTRSHPRWSAVGKAAVVETHGVKISVSHHPPSEGRAYELRQQGVVACFHGHTHRESPFGGPTHRPVDVAGSMPLYDVGVDANGYKPVLLTSALQSLNVI